MTKKLISDSPEYPERRRIEREVEIAINDSDSRLTAEEAATASLTARLDELDRFRSYGRALRFDGSSSYALGSTADGDIGPGGCVIDLFLRLGQNSGTTLPFFSSKRSGVSVAQGWNIFGETSTSPKRIYFRLEDDSSNQCSVIVEDDAFFADALGAGPIWRLTMRLNRALGEFSAYVNGVSVGTDHATAAVLGSVFSTDPLIFGAHHNGGTQTRFSEMDLVWSSIRYGDYTDEQIVAEGMDLPDVSAATDLWWDWDDGAGNTALAYPEWRRDFLDLDGTDDDSEAPDSANLSPTGGAFEYWFRAEDISNAPRPMAKPTTLISQIQADGSLVVFAHDGSGFHSSGSTAVGVVELYDLHHVVKVYDDFDDAFRIYLDGVMLLELAPSGMSPTNLSDTADDLAVGSNGGTKHLDGQIYGARFWDIDPVADGPGADTLRSTADLSGTSGLLAQYKADEGSGTTVGDSSGNGEDGTYNGSWGSNDLAVTGATWLDPGENWHLLMQE